MSLSKPLAGGLSKPLAGGLALGGWRGTPVDPTGAHNLYKIAPFYDLAATRRVDIAGIGDSNEIKGGGGWDRGQVVSLINHWPLYAGALAGGQENNGNGSGHGHWNAREGSIAPNGGHSGAPSAFDVLDLSGLGGHMQYFYLASGASKGPAWEFEEQLFGGETTQFTYHSYQGTFDASGGSFRWFARMNESPYWTIFNEAGQTTDGAANAMVWKNKARTGTTPYTVKIVCAATRHNASDVVGPFFCLYQRVSGQSVTSGVSRSTMVYKGGHSLRGMLSSLQGVEDLALQTYFQSVTNLQTGSETLLVRINSGVNDTGDSSNSLGPSPAASNTLAGFADNLNGMIIRLKAQWVAAGFDAGDLYFQLTPSHPTIAGDANLSGFRSAANGVSDANSNTSVINFAELTDELEMASEDDYLSAGDHSHLKNGGYERLAALETDLIAEYIGVA